MAKNILIIYPHWPPSNLVGVHRVRLIANYLHEFGWHPIVLTVHSDYYEEKLDIEMLKIVSETIEVHYVKALKTTKPRIVGDIGLRAFFQLKLAAIQLINKNKIDFIWISIPSFYTAILGRLIFKKTKIPFGIDYQDPWIRDISNRKNLRSILSIWLAKLLEPYAVKKVSLISGVAEAYYKPVIDRNFKNGKIANVAMSLGFDRRDHEIRIENVKYPWEAYPDCIPYIYAGAFLPNSGLFIEMLFKAIAKLKFDGKFDNRIKLFFIGTGYYTHKSITSFAEECSISENIVEIKDRFPYLHVLNFLSEAKGVMLIGSTEKHYTASKTYQVILSGKPVFSILHTESTAVNVLSECNAGAYMVRYSDDLEKEAFQTHIMEQFRDFIEQKEIYNPDISKLEKYSAKQSAMALVQAIESINT